MKYFVTGASGFVGKAVVKDLLAHGYEVLGLARNDASADVISKAGAQPHKGDLHDLESLKAGARAADGVIHLAFIHDFSSPDVFAKATAADRGAIQAMADAMAGTNKPFVITSGTLGYPKGVLATEDTEPLRSGPMTDRELSADLIFALSKEKGIRGMLVRLAPTTHGKGDWAFIPMLIGFAQKNGFVTVIGDGSSRWPAVHRDDAATAFRLAVEKGRPAATYNVVAESGVAMKDIVGLIGEKLRLPVESKQVEEAASTLGFFAHVIGADNPVSSEKTKRELGWQPVQPGLLADMVASYF